MHTGTTCLFSTFRQQESYENDTICLERVETEYKAEVFGIPLLWKGIRKKLSFGDGCKVIPFLALAKRLFSD